MPAEVHSRAITDAVAGGPLTNGSVNHGRFKVITHRQGGRGKKGRRKRELMAVVESGGGGEEEEAPADRLDPRRRSSG